MKLSGNVFGMKRVETDEFHNMSAHSCLGMPMLDPFREQNPNRKIWSFIGTGIAGNSRIDRVYVHSTNMRNITNIRYIHTPFHGHRVLTFNIKMTVNGAKLL